MYFDGSVMETGAGAGLHFVSPLREHMRYVVRLHFPVSNNMEEYEALLSGLRIAIELGVKLLDVRGDSRLVIDQVMKEARCHDEKMEAYCNAARHLKDKFDGLELNHIARKYNEEADELAKIASGRTTVLLNISPVTSPSHPSTPRPMRKPAERHPNTRGLRPSSHRPKTPRRRSPRPWTLRPRPPRQMRPKQWKSTRPHLCEAGVASTSTG